MNSEHENEKNIEQDVASAISINLLEESIFQMSKQSEDKIFENARQSRKIIDEKRKRSAANDPIFPPCEIELFAATSGGKGESQDESSTNNLPNKDTLSLCYEKDGIIYGHIDFNRTNKGIRITFRAESDFIAKSEGCHFVITINGNEFDIGEIDQNGTTFDIIEKGNWPVHCSWKIVSPEK